MTGSAYSVCISMVCREPRVIECRTCPCQCRMTSLASCWETCSCMIWTRRTIIIRSMTDGASGVHKLIITIRVTGLTLNRRMCACQGKFRGAMIKCRRLPRWRRMTGQTIM